MGIKLKVTPETLIKAADSIERQIQDIERQFSSIESDIGRTRSFWEGEASDEHKARFDAMKDEIAECLARLGSSPKSLLQISGVYRDTESDLETSAQVLLDNVIQ